MVHDLLQNKLNMSNGDLYLPTTLRMIKCGQFMSYRILSHKTFKGSIEKVGAIITDNRTRGSEARENVLFQKLDDNFIIISFAWNGFYPPGHIVHSNQYILIFKRVRKRHIKSMPQVSNSSIF